MTSYMQDISLYLETLGAASNAPIVALGAVEFDAETGQLGNGFHVRVDLASAVKAGAAVAPESVLWWLKQDDETRGPRQPGVPLAQALARFTAWMGHRDRDAYFSVQEAQENTRIWGNSSGVAPLDTVVLREAYLRLGMTPPWLGRNERCFHTLRAELPPVEIDREAGQCGALCGARWQARYLIAAKQALGQVTRLRASMARLTGAMREQKVAGHVSN